MDFMRIQNIIVAGGCLLEEETDMDLDGISKTSEFVK